MKEFAQIDGPQMADRIALNAAAQKHEGALEPDQHDQSSESQAASDPGLIPQNSSRMRRSPQPGGLTLFGGDALPSSLGRNPAAALPHFVRLDVDIVLIDSRMERYLRQYKIDSFYTPSSGLLTKESLFEVALQEPVHVIQRGGYWWCIAGEELLAEAKAILKPPRYFPMLLRNETTKDALRNIAVVEQVILPARHQMEPEFLKARVPVILNCSKDLPALFAQNLRDDQWATILRRSTRWFAGAKKSCRKADPADGE